MAQDAMNQMKSDKVLDADINRATTFEELQMLLHNAVERSPLGITRDVVTGQFVKREPADQDAATKAAAAAKTAADEAPRTFEKKGVIIRGKSFDFSAPSELELARQIASANEVAAALASDAAVTARSARHAASRTPEEIAIARSEAEIALRQGSISTAEFLERTGAFDEYLESKGIDIAQLSQDQMNKSWADATETFLQSSDWPGGEKNMFLIRDKLAALGLVDATDKVAALRRAYRELKEAGTLFDGDHTPEELEKLTANMSPVEIIQAWKQTQTGVANGDSDAANQAFIDIHRSGSSSLFGK
jgi:hypothetical protein